MLNMGRYTHMQRIALESHEITNPLLPQSLDKELLSACIVHADPPIRLDNKQLE